MQYQLYFINDRVHKENTMEQDLSKAMYENAIGMLVMNYIESLEPAKLPALAESSALMLIAEIKAILDDDSLEDTTCFYRTDALVDAFYARNVQPPRHDW